MTSIAGSETKLQKFLNIPSTPPLVCVFEIREALFNIDILIRKKSNALNTNQDQIKVLNTFEFRRKKYYYLFLLSASRFRMASADRWLFTRYWRYNVRGYFFKIGYIVNSCFPLDGSLR